MKHTHAATLEPGGSGGYNVRVSDLPGCTSHWEDLFDAAAMGTDAMSVWLAASEESDEDIPASNTPYAVKVDAPSFYTVLCRHGCVQTGIPAGGWREDTRGRKSITII